MTIFGNNQGYSRGGGGFNLRWIIAAVIAIGGIVTYYRQTQVNPVTGEKQHIALSVDQEKQLGLNAAPEMAQQMGGYVDPASSSDAAAVQRVGRRIVSESDASKSPYVGNFNFHLLNDNTTINAFALPGGQVFITRALYDKLDSESELAGVLGHEIGHVINRHSAEQMAKQQLGQSMVMATGVAATDNQGHGQMAAAAAAIALQMRTLANSRNDETEADTYGVKLMSESGYDPRGMMQVMKVLEDATKGSSRAEFLQTHPNPGNRLEVIKALIDKDFPNGVPSTLTKGEALPHGSRRL